MSDTLERLTAELIPEGALPADDASEEEKQAFAINDAKLANWASLRLQAQAKETADIETWRQERIARINEIADKEINRIEPRMNYLQWKLREYLQTLLKAGRKTKTLDLEGGTFSMTKRQPLITYSDEIIKWAEENAPQFVKRDPKLDASALKKYVKLAEDGALITPDGEIVPGHWENQPDSMNFKPLQK